MEDKLSPNLQEGFLRSEENVVPNNIVVGNVVLNNIIPHDGKGCDVTWIPRCTRAL